VPIFRVSLVNMPFAALDAPSLALTRLSHALRSRFGSRVATEIHYLNLDVARVMGVDFYKGIAESVESHSRGLGEWFFRQAAFPDLPDNSSEYFARYFPRTDRKSEAYRTSILGYRRQAARLLDELIAERGLHRADLVGFTSVFSQNTASFAMARKIKRLNPDTVTVIGGANCETPMGEELARHVAGIDFVFSGPALKSFPELVAHLLGKETASCHRIAGVFSRENCSGRRPAARHRPRGRAGLRLVSRRSRGTIPRRGDRAAPALQDLPGLLVGRAIAMLLLRPERDRSEPPRNEFRRRGRAVPAADAVLSPVPQLQGGR
jgi:magnesium-protoporphyrin IX monomethyl ester (oxidative) cyclase